MNEKKTLTTLQILGLVLLAVVVMNFVGGIVNSIINRDWDSLYRSIATLIVLGIFGYILWNRITGGWDSLMKRRDATREQFEKDQKLPEELCGCTWGGMVF